MNPNTPRTNQAASCGDFPELDEVSTEFARELECEINRLEAVRLSALKALGNWLNENTATGDDVDLLLCHRILSTGNPESPDLPKTGTRIQFIVRRNGAYVEGVSSADGEISYTGDPKLARIFSGAWHGFWAKVGGDKIEI